MLERSFVVGVDHHQTPVEVREFLAGLSEEQLSQVVGSDVKEMMLLSTCNRYEIYGVAESEEQATHMHETLLEAMQRQLGDQEAPLKGEIKKGVYHKTGKEMLHHGFRVASSLESMVVGEPQILGQMKQAYGTAQKNGQAHTFLERFCSSAFHTGKRVRSETALGEANVSVASVAVEQAKDLFPDLSDCRVLLIGAGKMGADTARKFKSVGVKGLVITSRNPMKATELATEVGGQTIAFEVFDQILDQIDIVISCTSSPEMVLKKNMLPERATPLYVADIAVPRDVEAAVGELPNCMLYDIDHLSTKAQSGLKNRSDYLEQAGDIVSQEVDAFVEWTDQQKNSHMICHLRGYFEEVRKETVERYPNATVEQVSRLLVNKLLHHPTMVLRGGDFAAEGMEVALGALFDMVCPREKNADEKKKACVYSLNEGK